MNIFNVGRPKITGNIPYENFENPVPSVNAQELSSFATTLEVHSTIDDVIVHSGAKELSYNYTGDGDVVIDSNGDKLKIEVKHNNSIVGARNDSNIIVSKGVTIINGVVVNGGVTANKSGSLTLNIPTHITRLVIHNSNGLVNVFGKYIDEVIVYNVNGNILMEDCGEATATTVNGDVTVKNSEVIIDTVNGNVQLMGGAGVVKTINGDIAMNFNAKGQYKIDTVNGSVN